METTLQILAEELNRPVQHVANVVQLLDEGYKFRSGLSCAEARREAKLGLHTWKWLQRGGLSAPVLLVKSGVCGGVRSTRGRICEQMPGLVIFANTVCFIRQNSGSAGKP